MPGYLGRAGLLAPALFLLAACRPPAPEGSLVVPRGATISVRLAEDISPSRHPPGSIFQAALDGPLSQGAVIFAADGAAVEGLVEQVEQQDSGPPRMTVRLVRLILPGGKSFPLDTDEVIRSSRLAEAGTGGVNALSGLEEKIRYLAESAPPAAAPPQESGPSGSVVIPRDARMVFTLRRDLVLPPAGS